jgi:hypothetical protein
MRDVKALLPLLRRHREALSAGIRLQAAASDGSAEELERAVAEALTFAGGELAEELQLEEAFLLPSLAALEVLEEGEVETVAFDHLRLRVLHLDLASEPQSRVCAAAFAAHLLAHTLWEEEELFPTWQARLTRWRAASAGSSAPSKANGGERSHLRLVEDL